MPPGYSGFIFAVSVPYLIIATFAVVFGSLGNLFVLGSVIVHKKLKNQRSVFLVNLAIAYLCVTSIADAYGIIGKYRKRY